MLIVASLTNLEDAVRKSLLACTAISALAIVSVTVGAQTLTRAATPAPATTFPSLTTIYVASGVFDDGGGINAGVATSVHCSNVSGQSAQVRVLVLQTTGAVARVNTQTVLHGNTQTFSTHETGFVIEAGMGTGFVQGVLNVESTQSAVFCSAMIVPAAAPQEGVALHMVRVNGHPGTIE
jgi:hypothetical protein